MVSRAELYSRVRELLENSGADSPRFDAQCIFQQAFGASFPRIMMDRELPVHPETEEKILDMAQKRSGGYPLQYILGEWEFYGYPFKVGEGVLIPRPDTETLVETALSRVRDGGNLRIADLCSGTGCVAVAVEKNISCDEIYAVENSDKAFEYLTENIRLNNSSVAAVRGDVLAEETAEKFNDLDMIVSNPPYLSREDMDSLQREVSFEPAEALAAGDDDLYYYRNITRLWKKSLRPSGIIAYEIGMDQHDGVAGILRSNGFINIEFTKDTAGIIRVVSAEKQEEN